MEDYIKNVISKDFEKSYNKKLPRLYLDMVEPGEPSKNGVLGFLKEGFINFTWLVPIFSNNNEELSHYFSEVRIVQTCREAYESMLEFDSEMLLPDYKMLIPFASFDGPTFCFDYRNHEDPPIVMMTHMEIGSDDPKEWECPMDYTAKSFTEFVKRMNTKLMSKFMRDDIDMSNNEIINVMGGYYFEKMKDSINYCREDNKKNLL